MLRKHYPYALLSALAFAGPLFVAQSILAQDTEVPVAPQPAPVPSPSTAPAPQAGDLTQEPRETASFTFAWTLLRTSCPLASSSSMTRCFRRLGNNSEL